MTRPWQPWRTSHVAGFFTRRQNYPTENGRSSMKAVSKVPAPIKVSYCWCFCVYNYEANTRRETHFASHILTIIIYPSGGLQIQPINYRRKYKGYNGKDMTGETLGFQSWENLGPAALDCQPKHVVTDHLSFSTIFADVEKQRSGAWKLMDMWTCCERDNLQIRSLYSGLVLL